MDREYVARQLSVAINGEPMLQHVPQEYRDQMVIDWTYHLSGNWEQMLVWKEQLAARKAEMEKEKV